MIYHIEAVADAIDDEFNKNPDDEPSSYQLARAAIHAYQQAVASESAPAIPAGYTELLEAALGLIGIIEGIDGIGYANFRSEKTGERLKDLTEWARFYVAAGRLHIKVPSNAPTPEAQ